MSEEKKFELSPSAAILIAGALIAGAIVYINTAPGQAAVAAGANEPSSAVRAPAQSDHMRGDGSAPIVLIEYSDFECPYCSTIYPTLKRIVEESNGQIAWVMRNLPLTSIHPDAEPAAHAAECIAEQLGNDGFWKYADAVFANQSLLSASYSRMLAKGFGADEAAYDACISQNKYQDKIDGESIEAQTLGATGTPFVVVLNTQTGKKAAIPGALPYTQAMAVINSVK